MDLLLQQRQFLIQHREAGADARAACVEHPKLGFTDCVQLSLAKEEGHRPLGTSTAGSAAWKAPDVSDLTAGSRTA